MGRSDATTPDEYLDQLAPQRAAELRTVRNAINAVLPSGYVERIAWGVISWEVPLETSGPTYNNQPLLYVGIGAQKAYNALYLDCAYWPPDSAARLKDAFAAVGKSLEAGKACIRFQSAAELPLEAIIAEIASSSPGDYAARHRAVRQAKL